MREKSERTKEIIAYALKSNESLKEIAKTFKVSRQFIHQILKREGITGNGSRKKIRLKTNKKEMIFEKFGYKCFYCEGKAEHLDHFVPTSKGGKNDFHNIVPACASCNLPKSDKNYEEFMKYVFELNRHHRLGFERTERILAKHENLSTATILSLLDTIYKSI